MRDSTRLPGTLGKNVTGTISLEDTSDQSGAGANLKIDIASSSSSIELAALAT
jgi:hypothetical protein